MLKASKEKDEIKAIVVKCVINLSRIHEAKISIDSVYFASILSHAHCALIHIDSNDHGALLRQGDG